MPKSCFWRISLLVLFTFVSTGLDVHAQDCPVTDLTDDCRMDFADLLEFGLQWLDIPGGSANFDGVPGVDMDDFVRLAADWGVVGIPPVRLVINEFMADNEGFYLDPADDDYEDWIEIYNYGDTDIDMAGMYLTDDLTVPDMWMVPLGLGDASIVPAGGYLLIWADNESGQEGLHASFGLSKGGGEDVGLFDANDNLVDSIVDFGPQLENHSLGRFPNGGAPLLVFGSTLGSAPTPGEANSTDPADDNIVITEIMYHPYHDVVNHEPDNVYDEYIELCNKGAAAIDMVGWQFTDGIDFVFPVVTLNAGEYLVVAADLVAFQIKYPAVSNVVAGWIGRLRNSGERIRLSNAEGRLIDEVRYSDAGDWAQRELGELDHEHRGWSWSDAHDGDGSSLELINIDVSNEYGQNWIAGADGGSPGEANPAALTDIAPLILDASHSPVIPGSGEAVTVTADIIDENPAGVTATLYYRVDISTFNKNDYPVYDAGDFTTITMVHDGGGVYSAQIPAQADGAIIEFFVEAVDGGARKSTRPGPSMVDGTPQQVTNMLYQVDDSFDSEWTAGDVPRYYITMTENERARLYEIGDGDCGDPFSGECKSNANMNATFISVDGVDTKVRFGVGVRNRGNWSRMSPPMNYHINFHHDDLWKGMEALNLNCEYTYLQVIGSAIWRMAGLAATEARLVEVKVNGLNLTIEGPNPDYGRTYGYYAAIEVYDRGWVENNFPDDPDGNLYRCGYFRECASCSITYADLEFHGDPPYHDPDDYRLMYKKKTNASKEDWSDLFDLLDALNDSSGSENEFLASAGQIVNVEQWMRFLATDSLIGNLEGGLSTGDGDDYAMYCPLIDRRFRLNVHDLDTILSQTSDYDRSLFMYDGPSLEGMHLLINNQDVIKLYYNQYLDLIETAYSAEKFDFLTEVVLGGRVPDNLINNINQSVVRRINDPSAVLDQIPRQFTIVAPAMQNGYPYTTSSSVSLSGKFDATTSRSMRVNGQLVSDGNWSQKYGDWSIGGIALNPGINRITVEAFDESDGNGSSVYNEFVDVWCDDGPISDVVSLASNTTLDAASGPWRIATSMTVPAGVTLTIEAGTTVYFDQGVRLTVNGRLAANGTEYNRIRLTVDPVSSATWGGIGFDGSAEDNQMVCVDMESSSSAGESIRLDDSRVLIDDATWSQTNDTILQIERSSAIVRNSVFPDNTSAQSVSGYNVLAANPYLIFDNNIFGVHTGTGQDVLGCTVGGPTPVAQFTNNIFLGGGDDALDLDGTHAFVAGNTFRNFHRNFPATDDESYAVTSCYDGSQTSSHKIVRNLFIDCDHAALVNEGSWIDFQNNTVVNCLVGVNFREPNETGVDPGLGGYMAGNIFYNTPDPVAAYYWNEPGETDSDVTVEYSIIPLGIPSAFRDSGNILNADPLFVDAGNDDYHLKSDSAAVGGGFNGIDMGMYVPTGASISGPNSLTTAMIDITYTIAGPAITHYKWRLDGGAWSVTEASVDTAIVLSSLSPGVHTLEVIGKNYAGIWQEQAEATVRTWSVDSLHVGLIINEVLSHSHGVASDLIELYYDGPGTLDMAGMSITDNSGEPLKHVFGGGTTIAAGEYMVLIADPLSTVPGHLDFALSSLGDEVYLYDAGETLIDSVELGIQWRYWTVGRLGDGEWHLTVPTLGSPNVKQPLGDPADLKINEWLANGDILFVDDFIELYNPGAYPVNLSDLYLTDNHVTQPLKSCLGPLSFIEPNGYAVFQADDSGKSAHVDFKLSADHEILALYDGGGNEIDKVIYYAQKTDVSQGRSPDGSDDYAFFTLPTPWLANPVVVGDETTEINLMQIDDEWAYDESNTDLGTAWRDPNYDDDSWPRGDALLYYENSGLPAPKNTELYWDRNGVRTYYFRSHFNIPSGVNVADIDSLEVAHVIDDGAVFYINGVEALRFGFDDDTVVTHSSITDDHTVGNATYAYGTIPTQILQDLNLQVGENLIAVEVHQTGPTTIPTSSDIVFGLALDAVVSASQGDDPLADAKALLDNLRITELMYNPANGEEYEFVELQNIGTDTLDLSGVRFTDGIEFTFPVSTELAAGGYVVLATDLTAFASRYPTVPAGIVFGPYDGKFNNGGEKIVLQLPEPFEAAILRFEYSDLWYPLTDGDSFSLVIGDPTAHRATWDEPESWRSSSTPGGSPGTP